MLVAFSFAPPSADAAKRKVPFGFFGSVVSPALLNPSAVGDLALDQQMALMARSGVEALRVVKAWGDLEPAQGSYNFALLDRVVGAGARHGLPAIIGTTATPRWASSKPTSRDYYRLPPADPGTYGELMRQLVLRYGPSGTFWAENPTLPRTPVRQWQIWNEPSGPAHWLPRPWAPSYTRLLKAAYEAIHGADRGAKVAAGPLVATGTYTQWAGARALYKAGADRYFDLVSIHPFTNSSVSVSDTAQRALEIVRRVRAVMRRGGDARKPVILTEVTWPASIGSAPKGAQLHFSVTKSGQKARLKAAYAALARSRRTLRVTNAYWYTWATSYDRSGPLSVMAFNFSGLTRFNGGAFRPMPILKTYASAAARYQGCRKTSNARRCR